MLAQFSSGIKYSPKINNFKKHTNKDATSTKKINNLLKRKKKNIKNKLLHHVRKSKEFAKVTLQS